MEALTNSDPSRIGPYRLLSKLGAGGMGQVYLARSEGGRTVAVKLVRAELAVEPEFRRRFAQEVEAARRVGGEWTAPVLDADTEAKEPWVATGYVPGPTLHEAVARNGRALPESSVRVLANRLAQGLGAIHGAGLIHRDLKPGNVLVTIDGPLVIDFGIARALDAVSGTGKLTRTGAVVGSPGFMSPEQVRGESLTAASDVFCLGSVLAFAATARAPFGGGESGMHGVMFRIAQEEPDLAGLPEGLSSLVRDCLAKEPGARPTPAEVAERTADAVPDSGESEPWLPAGLIAHLGRHAAQLLDAETPAAMAQPPMPVGPPTPLPGAVGFGAAAPVPPMPMGAPTPVPGSVGPVPAMPAGPPTPLPGGQAGGVPGSGAPSEAAAPPLEGAGEAEQAENAALPTPPPGFGPVPTPTTPSASAPPPGFGPPPGAGYGGTPPGGTTPLGGYGSTPPGGATPPPGFGPVAGGGAPGTPSTSSTPGAPGAPKPRKPRRGLIVAVSVVAVLALGGGGTLVAVNAFKTKDEGKSNSKGQQGGGAAKATPKPTPPVAGGQGTDAVSPTAAPSATGAGSGTGSVAGAVPAGYLGIWQGEVKKSDGTVDALRRFTIKQGAEGEEVIDTVNSADKQLCEGVSTLISAGNLLEVDTKRVVKSLPEPDDCSPSGKQTLRLRPDGTIVWTDGDGTTTAVLRKVPPMAKEAVPAPLIATWKRTFKSEDGATHNTVLKISQGTYGEVVMKTTGDGDNYHCEWESSLVDVGTNGASTLRLAPSVVTASEPKEHCKSGDSSTELLELRGAQLIITQAGASSDTEPASYRRTG
ncbi:protein kinase [Streptomyces sp. NBC_00237]|uniref:protein kinase domain-containing protein n=1 Tax=Streptomyces sp. NBC_00237 TaxID=2975687 RepID=UPI002253E7D8|nr:protein kinase [Streptomyces sp. NBC_00237]MCX5207278.1 protein kinase [Streptomyces sp. NBC_00237]